MEKFVIKRFVIAVTINSMNKSNRWYVTKNLLTKEERGKEEKNEGKPGAFIGQDARGSKCC